MTTIYTIGHSNHDEHAFLHLLGLFGVGLVADVRSHPYSRFSQFNREFLDALLRRYGLGYLFLGRELGAREPETQSVVSGEADWTQLPHFPLFSAGLGKVVAEANQQTVALLCAEKEPLDCHRTVVVCRLLRAPELRLRHILADGTDESHADTEQRLLARAGVARNLFDQETSDAGLLERAYDQRAREILGHPAAEEEEP
jgi:uncharacterized protein (DUF488 family)